MVHDLPPLQITFYIRAAFSICYICSFHALAGSHTEAVSPVALSSSNKAIHHLRTKQIHLYRTSHTGAMRYPVSEILLYCAVI